MCMCAFAWTRGEEEEQALERRHPPKWNTKPAAAAAAHDCILKNYIRVCGTTTQWLNRISKRKHNEHEHNKDNLQSKNAKKNANTWDFLSFCVCGNKILWHSMGRESEEAVDIGSFF